MTTLKEFRSSLASAAPPDGVDPALQALWWAGKGEWKRAHEVVQKHEDDERCNWVHAHLHHQEGDLSNAGYWYKRAGKPKSTVSVEQEWAELAGLLLKKS